MAKGSLSTGREGWFLSTLWIFTLMYTVRGGTLTYSYHNEKKDWMTAATICEGENKRLLSLKSSQDFKQKLVDPKIGEIISNGNLWIGLRTENNDCTSYIWHGLNLLAVWTNWRAHEPNNCLSQKCVLIRPKGWRSRECDKHYSFICESIDDAVIIPASVETKSTTNSTNTTTTIATDDNNTIALTIISTGQNAVIDSTTVATNDNATSGSTRFAINQNNENESTTVASSENATSKSTSFATNQNNVNESTTVAINKNATTESTSFATNQNNVNESATVATDENATTVSTTRKTEVDSTTLGNFLTSVGENLITMESTTKHPVVMDDQSRNCSSICLDYASRNVTNPCTEVAWSDKTNNSAVSDSLKEEIKKIQSELRVVKNSTQLSIRRRISVFESRTSAVVMGTAASIILSATCMFIVLLDTPNFIRFVRNIFH